ncbi:MAG: hypothetical protein ACXWKR_16885 [Phenylobacterium sp.]
MILKTTHSALGLGAVLTLLSANAGAAPADAIASAVSAAPAAIGAGATVMTMDGKVLRKGTNGWTCFPDDPGTPGKDPMCVDKNGMDWMSALMAKKPPPSAVGMAYVLQGGSDASNLDPFVTKPPAGAKWVATGPHTMVLSASVAAASGYASKQAAPDTSKPYVMYGGTPYAHIMFPVK